MFKKIKVFTGKNSTKKRYSNFFEKVIVFEKICFKVKKLKY